MLNRLLPFVKSRASVCELELEEQPHMEDGSQGNSAFLVYPSSVNSFEKGKPRFEIGGVKFTASVGIGGPESRTLLTMS